MVARVLIKLWMERSACDCWLGGHWVDQKAYSLSPPRHMPRVPADWLAASHLGEGTTLLAAFNSEARELLRVEWDNLVWMQTTCMRSTKFHDGDGKNNVEKKYLRFYLWILWYSNIISFVYHCQDYHKTESGTQHYTFKISCHGSTSIDSVESGHFMLLLCRRWQTKNNILCPQLLFCSFTFCLVTYFLLLLPSWFSLTP